MASIRRTLSPCNDRPYENGGGLFSGQSSPHKLLSSGKCSSMLSTFVVGVHKFFGGIFLAKHSRKNQNHSQWKRSFCRCLLLFFVGFLFGMTPFGSFEDLRSHDFAFEIKPPPVNVQKDPENAVISRPENFIVNKVQLAVDSELNVKGRFDYRPRKQLIVVTPTYNRALQAYYLHRLGQVLSLVQPPLLWIVVEMKSASVETAEILRNTRVMYRHLVCNKNLTNIKDRGVHQRNTALDHIELHKLDGIVYFADDDNIYSIELFESMREISHFGTWPVAMLTQSKNKAILEGPVCNGSQVIGWHTNEKSKRLRRFHVDMSGFAFNSTILWNSRLHRRISNPIRQLNTVKEGFQETTFIEQMVKDESQMEGIPTNCSKILNWHLHLEVSDLVYPRGWLLPKKLDVLPIR